VDISRPLCTSFMLWALCQHTIGGEGDESLSLTLLKREEGRLGDELQGGWGFVCAEGDSERKLGDWVASMTSWLEDACLPGAGCLVECNVDCGRERL